MSVHAARLCCATPRLLLLLPWRASRDDRSRLFYTVPTAKKILDSLALDLSFFLVGGGAGERFIIIVGVVIIAAAVVVLVVGVWPLSNSVSPALYGKRTFYLSRLE